MNSYLETLNYASSNEDSASEMKALQIKETDSILCITGSGGRTLDLLICNPSSIVSIDFNPCQNYLLELKMEAIRHMEYAGFLGFLGVTESRDRLKNYVRLESGLSAGAKDFWARNIAMIEKGVIYQGRWERYFRRLARLVRLFHPLLLRKLCGCTTLIEQRRFRESCWSTSEWRAFLRLISSRLAWKYLLGDPGFFRFVPRRFPIWRYIDERLTRGLMNFPAAESDFVCLLFSGRFDPGGSLPPYLEKKNYPLLKKNLSRVRTITCSLGDFLEGLRSARFDKFSLSDFTSYTDGVEYERIWKGIVRASAPQARVCERQFLVKRDIPRSVRDVVRRDVSMEMELEAQDTSLFYTFVVAEMAERNNA